MKRNLVYVVGLGPGDPQFLTAQAKTALENADVLCGYTVYIDLIRSFYPEKEVHATGMTKEIDRCRWALETAQSGKTVALVCSGDAGVYGILLQNGKSEETVCGIVRNIGRERQQSEIITLRELENKQVDMFTTVYIGNKATKNIEGKMVTPRGYRTV